MERVMTLFSVMIFIYKSFVNIVRFVRFVNLVKFVRIIMFVMTVRLVKPFSTFYSFNDSNDLNDPNDLNLSFKPLGMKNFCKLLQSIDDSGRRPIEQVRVNEVDAAIFNRRDGLPTSPFLKDLLIIPFRIH